MKKYYVYMTGEDGAEFTEIIEAANHMAAEDKARKAWPESRIDLVESELAKQARDFRLYQDAQREYDAWGNDDWA